MPQFGDKANKYDEFNLPTFAGFETRLKIKARPCGANTNFYAAPEILDEMKTPLILILLLFIVTLQSFCQSAYPSKCEAFKYLINSNEVTAWFGNPVKPGDSTIYLLDPADLLSYCKIDTWRGYTVKIVTKGELIDSLKKYDFHFVANKRYNYYQIRESAEKNEVIILFHRGYDNLSCNIKIKKTGQKYRLIKIESGVF